MATPAWLAMTATGWVPALHLPDFSVAAIEIFATFLVTGEAVFGSNNDFREFGKLFKMLHVHFQVQRYSSTATVLQCYSYSATVLQCYSYSATFLKMTNCTQADETDL